MVPKEISTILLIGSDAALGYLLQRYAERSGYQLVTHQKILSAGDVQAVNPMAIFFLSTELLEAAQALMDELENQDRGIVVCSSVADEARAMELGADYFLSHPLTYDNFYQALAAIGVSKHV